MQHHDSAKETDITAVLVVALVLMVGVLIAKTAGDFTAKSTSISTRAAEADEECRSNKPLNDGYYNSSGDWCETNLKRRDNKEKKCSQNSAYKDFTKGAIVCGLVSKCCRGASSIKVLGDTRCKREVGQQSICATDCKSKGFEATKTLCALADTSNNLNTAYCCKTPSPTPTPTPIPVDGQNENCGTEHINCTKTFKNGSSGVKITDREGNILSSVCSYTRGETVDKSRCMISLENSSDKDLCDGLQYASTIYYVSNGTDTPLYNGCIVSSYGVAGETEGGKYKVCETVVKGLSQKGTCP